MNAGSDPLEQGNLISIICHIAPRNVFRVDVVIENEFLVIPEKVIFSELKGKDTCKLQYQGNFQEFFL